MGDHAVGVHVEGGREGDHEPDGDAGRNAEEHDEHYGEQAVSGAELDAEGDEPDSPYHDCHDCWC